MTRFAWLAAVATAVIAAADLATTRAGLRAGYAEAMPGTAWLLATMGENAMLAATVIGKAALVVLVVVSRWWGPSMRRVCAASVAGTLGLMAAVVAHNVSVIGGAR